VLSSPIIPIECTFDTAGRVMVYYVAAPCPALIDTGCAQHPEGTLRAALRAHGGDLAAIQAVINTHGHWDHAGGNAATRAASGARILIHERGAEFLVDDRPHLDGYATAASRALDDHAGIAAQRAAFPARFFPGAGPDQLLRDGDRIDLGDGIVFEVFHAPGHAEDTIALWWAEAGVLIAGDAAHGTGSRPGSCPLYFGSIAQTRASIARLRALPFTTLHTSHFFGRHGRRERVAVYDAEQGKAFFDESLAALATMEEALRAALAAKPDATFPRLARAATAHLIALGGWPVVPHPDTGVAHNAAPTLHSLWRELTTG
jgi:glyoxylase-like metal-dependent hydrolase (beta-lactamase superfamily II)